MFPEIQPLDKRNSIFTISQKSFRYQVKKVSLNVRKNIQILDLSEKAFLRTNPLDK